MKKQWKIILVFGVFFAAVMHAGWAIDDLPKKVHAADEAYSTMDYVTAQNIYEELLAEAPNDPHVLYNLATIYASQEQKGLAIWLYLRALFISPRDGDIRYNLSLLEPEWEEFIAVTPLPVLDKLFYWFSANEWATVAGVATTLALLLGFAMLKLGRGSRLREIVQQAFRVAIVVACVTYPFAALHYHTQVARRLGVIVAEQTYAYSGPSDTQARKSALAAGTIVEVDASSSPDWRKVTFGGNVGYVKKEKLRRL